MGDLIESSRVAPLPVTCPEAKEMQTHSSSNGSGTSFFRTCFNGINTLLGLGILSIPYALSEGGWLSLILLFMIAIACCYTGVLLQKCMESNSLVKTYPDIGHLAFGYRGRLLISIFMYLELYLVAVEFLILEGDHLEKLFPSANFNMGGLKISGKHGLVLIAALVILPTTWLRSLGLLAYVSMGGVLASGVVVGCVIWAGAFDGVGFHERGRLVNWSGMPIAVSLYAFCFCGHPVFPTLYTSMKNRTKFSNVLSICFALCTLNYGLMAVMGYAMYGPSVNSQVTLNLPAGKLSTKIAIYTTLINPLAKYALVVTPIANALEERFHVSKKRFISVLIRTVIVISTVVVALTVPFFGYVVALTGSFLSSTATMLLPCICYLKIFKNKWPSVFELGIIAVIMVMGALIASIGTYTSLKQIIHKL